MGGADPRFFTDERWSRAEPLIAKVLGPGPKGDARRFLEGVGWILRSGAPWRDLARHFGPWERIYRRYRRWALSGRWERLRKTRISVEAAKLLLDTRAYEHRNVIERWFGRMKVFRRVATRYEKTALSYLGAVAAAAWLVAVTGWHG